jgi:hypothetical protein
LWQPQKPEVPTPTTYTDKPDQQPATNSMTVAAKEEEDATELQEHAPTNK